MELQLILLTNRLTEGKQLAQNHPDSEYQSLNLKSTLPPGPHPLLDTRKGIFQTSERLR